METEVSVQSLLDKIKREGIEEAQKAAQEIVDRAHSEAESVMGQARDRSRQLVQEAQKEADRRQKAADQAMTQAARDLLLALQQEMTALCMKIMERQVRAALTPEVMKEIILKTVERWKETGDEQAVEVLLSEEEAGRLEELLAGSLQGEMQRGLVLRPLSKLQGGFRIGEMDGAMHFDFTPEGIAQVLGEYVNPRIARYISEASRGGRENSS